MAITQVPTGPAVGKIRPIVYEKPVTGVRDTGWSQLLTRRSAGIPMASMNPRLTGIVTSTGDARVAVPVG